MYGMQGNRSEHEKMQEVRTGLLCGVRIEGQTAISEDICKKYLSDVRFLCRKRDGKMITHCIHR